MGLRRDLLRQLRDSRTRSYRNSHSHYEVDRIAHQTTPVHSRTVLPSGLTCLSAHIATLLEGCGPAQGAQISRRPGLVIAGCIAGNDQCGTGERYDNGHNSDHQDGCAPAFGGRGSLRRHCTHRAAGSGTACARASSGTATSQRPSGRALTRMTTVTRLGRFSIVIVAPEGAAALALATAASSARAACLATAAAASTQRSWVTTR
jgi:hypothetical protein